MENPPVYFRILPFYFTAFFGECKYGFYGKFIEIYWTDNGFIPADNEFRGGEWWEVSVSRENALNKTNATK